MKYEDPDLIDRLASEYVLGTLHGLARRRFERLLLDSEQAQQAVVLWQENLGDLVFTLPPQAPPSSVWQSIDQIIRSDHRTSKAAAPPNLAPPSLALWRGWAMAASIGMITAVGYIAFQTTQQAPDPLVTQATTQQQQVAFVDAINVEPLWVVSMNFDTGELSTQAISATAQDIDKVYELWMLPEQGNPRSLGLLPVDGGATKQSFSPVLLELLRASQGLAVSIEPPGGSPTGVPTGPVVYQASLFDLT